MTDNTPELDATDAGPNADQLAHLRRKAKALKKSYELGDTDARAMVEGILPDAKTAPPKHADFLHVIARSQGFRTWPEMKAAVQSQGLDRASQQTRLRMALFNGQHDYAAQLLTDTPDLAAGQFGLLCALFDRQGVASMLAQDPGHATRMLAPRRPILHLAFSKHLQADPSLDRDMLAIAQMLIEHGADVNDSFMFEGSTDPLPALYGALGHAGNMPLARWLLERGANPNDNESLYHATELGHADGVALLLEHGARPDGTNAMLRAMDFNAHEMVQMMVGSGASVTLPNSVAPNATPLLHHAARRMCDARMVQILMSAGADPSETYQGYSAYGFARVYGNQALVTAIETAGPVPDLTPDEALLARAADGLDSPGQWIDPAKLPDEYRNVLCTILAMPAKLDHMKRLVALGVEYDRPEGQGLTPVQMAGWEGLPEILAFFLRLKPDLGHVNNYGGTLFSTILHGSENCPARADRDHLECLRLVLVEGVALPKAALNYKGNAQIAAFLAEWAAAYPSQVVAHGVV